MNNIHRSMDLRGLSIFLQVAADRSFTLAAERLGITPSAISKAIGRLEAELGAILFVRAARSVSLTAEGQRFLGEAERLAVAIERARNVVATPPAAPKRRLRVALPINFGRAEIAPRLPMFAQRFPDLVIEYLLVNNGQLDLDDRRIDLALLMGPTAPLDSRFVIEDVAQLTTLLCAAPSYLERHSTPCSLKALADHAALGGIDEIEGNAVSWDFRIDGRVVSHRPNYVFLSNAIEVLVEMAIAGSGIVQAPDYLVADAIRTHQLRTILDDVAVGPLPVRIAVAADRQHSPEVQAFAALLHGVVQQRVEFATRQRRLVA